MHTGPVTAPPGLGLTNPVARRSGLAREQSEFARILSMAEPAAHSSAPADPAGTGTRADARARDAAEQLVAKVLVEPILKQMRESNHAAPPFAPTDGEKQFQSMLDAKLAHRITSAARFPLVDRLAHDLRRSLRTEAHTTPDARV